MGALIVVIYIFFLVCTVIYYSNIIYKNYKEGLPLGDGINPILRLFVLLFIVIGQCTIPSALNRMVVIFVFSLMFFTIYTIIGIHNRKNHSGDLFRFFYKEVKNGKICTCIGMGFIILAMLVVCFTGQHV